jgi:hypothetical protein
MNGLDPLTYWEVLKFIGAVFGALYLVSFFALPVLAFFAPKFEGEQDEVGELGFTHRREVDPDELFREHRD